MKGERCHTSKCAIVKRNYVPGVHGIKRQPRLSEYGTQFRAKQKAKRIYGVMERQFINYYKKAIASDVDSAVAIKRMLEQRFDNVVYRLGFAKSRFQARQMISHNHFTVNGKKMNIASYQVRVGDTIQIKEKSLRSPLFKDIRDRLAQIQLPSWVTLDKETLTGKVVSMPLPEDLEDTIEAEQIVEFYSRF